MMLNKKTFEVCKALMSLIWFMAGLGVSAQTDYFYMLTSPRHDGDLFNRRLISFGVNSNSFRELPDEPHVLESVKYDNTSLNFVQTVAVSDPGPFLYAIRTNPYQIYGYRRLVDGRVEELDGFPMTFLNPEGTSQDGPTWTVKHPHLPIFYGVEYYWDRIRAFEVLPDGQLGELKNSPYVPFPVGLGPLAMCITPDGLTAFLVMFDFYQGFYGLLSADVDPKTGDLSDFQQAMNFRERPFGIGLSSNGRYLYVTNQLATQIYGFNISGRTLSPLAGFPKTLPLDPTWIWIQGDYLAMGGYQSESVALWKIHEDGQISLTPGSPFPVDSDGNFYAAFSPRTDRIIFGGNTNHYLFDIGEDGRLILNHPSVFVEGISYGVSAAPELKGDPSSLRFSPDPQIGDTTVTIRGDAHSPFYLVEGEACLGPFLTDDQGLYHYETMVTAEFFLEIKSYCDEQGSSDQVATVPTLSEFAFVMLCVLLCLIGIKIKQFQKRSLI